MDKQPVMFRDLGIIDYKKAWDYQENLLQANVAIKSAARLSDEPTMPLSVPTQNYFLLCEHPPVYTLGKSGDKANMLLSDSERNEKGIDFYQINRGGDITFHGLQQIVGYPILDLEKFYTDIGRYLRNLEEVVILTLAQYDIFAGRSDGETGVWLDPGIIGRERKICAIGVRCSRWITMHGFALNVNTDLGFFENIVPCGIQNKQVTSMQKEKAATLNYEDVKDKLKTNFKIVFNCDLNTWVS